MPVRPGDRRDDFGVAENCLRVVDRRLIEPHLRIELIDRRALRVALLGRRRIGRGKARVALQIEFRIREQRRVLRSFRDGLIVLRLIRRRIDFGEDIALRHVLPFLEPDLQQLAVDLRKHRDGVQRFRRADAVEINRHVRGFGGAHQHRHRAALSAAAAAARLLLFLAAALHIERGGDREREHREQREDNVAAIFRHFGAGTGMPLHTYPFVAASTSASVGGQPPPSA